MRYLTLSFLSVFLSGLAAWLVPAQQASAAIPATTGIASVPATSPSVWPHTIQRDQASVTIYQPQAISWPDRKLLTARTAVAITPAGQTHPLLGTVEISLQTETDENADIVRLSDPKLLKTHFPSLDTQQAAVIEAKIAAALPEMQTKEVPLSALLLSLNQTPVKSVELQNEPPRIFHADRPASLVVFDGEPVLVPVGTSGLSYAVNTNWDVFTIDSAWYLRNNGIWMQAEAATGPYAVTTKLPAALNALPADARFMNARKALPARSPKASDLVPTVFVSTSPASIIVTDGAPKLAPVSGTSLQRVTNTPSTLFLDSSNSTYYVLLAGRWFAAGTLEGPWAFASDRLPADFALIPTESPEAAILPSVPGTVQAQEAVMKAQIPTTATLKRDAAKITVTYVGPPRFAPIAGTTIMHAVNTSSVVLKIGDAYYACEGGAWFVSPAPTGPWKLADSLPPVIRTIPPSSPYYSVTYVQVYGATPYAVTYGYTAGYLQGFVTAGVLVYGTGYTYPPAIVAGPVPVFLPYPYTYASNVAYNTATGAWVQSGSVVGPASGATGARYYNPQTGAYARGGEVWGPNGGAGAWSAYNPSTGSYARGSASWSNGSGSAQASHYNARTGISGSTNQNWNPYQRWGSSTFAGPNQTVNTRSASNAQGSAGAFQSSTGAQGAGYHNSATGSRGGAVQTANGDVYAGRDGNVYQHSDGSWSKWNDGGWQPVNPPGSTKSANTSSTTRSTNRPQSGTTSARGNSSVGGTSQAANVDRGSWSQLQHDQLGRQFGRGEGGGFQSRSGGGRFRR